jgi:membrane protease subunit (stomatin/prohibitin family)
MKGHGTARLRLERPIDFFENYGAKFAGGDNNAVVTMDSLETFFTAAKNRVTEAIAMSIQELGDKKPMRYNQIMQASNMKDLRELVNMQMEDTDLSKIGFDFYEFTVGGSGFIISEEDRAAIAEMQTLAFQASNMGMANIRTQQMMAAKFGEGAAGTAAAVMMGSQAGMGGMGNVQAQPAQQFGQQPAYGQNMMGGAAVAPAAPAADAWTCSCGATATGKFCNNCGSKKPEPKPVDGWTCSCGNVVTGKFCNNCGQPKPEPKPANGWTCSCGNVVEDGMFCSNCGSKKPAPQAAVVGWTCSCGNVVTEGDFCSNCGSRKPEANKPKKFVCDKCGWTSDNINTRFCPKCGDRGTEADIQ